MSVVAKFYVSKKTQFAGQSNCTEITLHAVSRGEENKSWAAYTPSGQMSMTVLNEVAAEAFELGTEYLVRFDPASPAE